MTTSPWISVKDRLPNDDRLVLLGFDTSASQIVGRYTKDGWVDHPTRAFRCPTHWMPLPDPPKPEDQFEKYFAAEPGKDTIWVGNSRMSVFAARLIWDTAIASQKTDKCHASQGCS